MTDDIVANHRILLILEHPRERMDYAAFLEGLGFRVDGVPDGAAADAYLSATTPDMVIADDTTPGLDPHQFLKKLSRSHPRCLTLFISARPEVDQAISLMTQGAMDYFIKPLDMRQLELWTRRAGILLRTGESPEERPAVSAAEPVRIITRNRAMENLLRLASRVADSSASVLIQGESGTGKELFARFLHDNSSRSSQPFVAINCAALPENLMESELFGHEKGAFTGAIFRKTGKFELAHKGTIFLDEITEMQYHLQSKLLRVLQERTLDRVGGTRPVTVDVRVIATTNRDALQAVADGVFREDLYYRLNTIPLIIPPLRERRDDLEALCRFFIEKYSIRDGRDVRCLTPEALSRLMHHPFPGNVRELENIIHRAVLLATAERIHPEDLLMDPVSGDICPQRPEEAESPADLPAGSLKNMEQKMIYQALDQTEGNRTHAAKILGISVRTLRNKLNEYRESE